MPLIAQNNLLLFFAKIGSLNLVKMSVSMGADLNCRTEYGATALHLAIACSNIDMVIFLINHGANIEIEDNLGLTPSALAETYIGIIKVKFLKKLFRKVSDLESEYSDLYISHIKESIKEPYLDSYFKGEMTSQEILKKAMLPYFYNAQKIDKSDYGFDISISDQDKMQSICDILQKCHASKKTTKEKSTTSHKS